MTRRFRDLKAGAWVAYVTTAIVLLAGLLDRTLLRPSPAVAAPYHERMRVLATQLPTAFGNWVGVEAPVPEAAQRILHANAIVSRGYHNLVTGEQASLLVVLVSDARDILGHFPPVCYPAQGWTRSGAVNREWTAVGRPIYGVEYQFTRDRLDGMSRLTVDNYLFLPGGRTCRGMEEVEAAAQSRLEKLYGAGQVQVVFSTPISPERRDAIVKEFAAVVAPILNVQPSATQADSIND